MKKTVFKGFLIILYIFSSTGLAAVDCYCTMASDENQSEYQCCRFTGIVNSETDSPANTEECCSNSIASVFPSNYDKPVFISGLDCCVLLSSLNQIDQPLRPETAPCFIIYIETSEELVPKNVKRNHCNNSIFIREPSFQLNTPLLN